MENDAENFQSIQTALAVQVSDDKCEKALNNISPSINSESCLNDVPAKINKNELPKSILDGENSLRMKTYSRVNRILKTKFKTINVKLSTSHSDRTKTTKISMNESTKSSASSSDEEVLQTRFSVKNDNIFKADEYHSNDYNPILPERTSGKESILENESNTETSPIIIQAIPYNGKNAPNDSNNNKKMTKMKQHEVNNINEINMEITDRDSLSVEANYSNDIGSNSIQISSENSYEQFDIKDQLSKMGSHDVSLKKPKKNITVITEQDLTGTDLEKSDIASDGIVKDLFNGSFDINTYLLKRRPSVESYEKCILLNTKQFENKSVSPLQVNAKNIHRKNEYDKKVKNELVTANKKAKHSNSYHSKKEFFRNSSEVLTRGLNKKTSDIKKIKNIQKLQTEIKKENKNSVHKRSEDFGKFNLKPLSKVKEKNKTQQKNITKDTSLDREEDLTLSKFVDSPNKTSSRKRNISRKKYKDNSIVAESNKESSLTRYSTRKTRNSSLIASRKIKEIEKLENLSDSYDEMLNDCDGDIHYVSSLYNFQKNSNSFLTGKAYTNRLKVNHENNMLNIAKNKLQAENSSEENVESKDISQYYFREDGMKNIEPTRYKKTVLETPSCNLFKVFDQNIESSSIKGRLRKNTSKNFISDLNLADQYFTQERNKDLRENQQDNSKKRSRKDKSEVSKSAVDNSYYKVNKNEPTNNAKHLISFNKAINESKHRSWDILERELLKELDEMPLTDKVCKTVILQEEEVVREKNFVNELLKVSNTSMLQTMNKSKTRNKYNMQYEIKNTERKILESKAETANNLHNRFSIPFTKASASSNSKNINILDRTIAAMKKCTTKFIPPQAKMCDYEQKESGFQFGNISDHETQFHSSVTFMANDNKQYYSNKIVGYLKKSNRRSKKNINFEQRNKVTEVLSDFREQLRESDHENSDDAEHSEQSVTASRNHSFKNYPQKRSCNEKSQALVPYSEEKNIDLWDKLLKKLDLEENYEEDEDEHPLPNPVDTSKTNEDVKEKFSELLIIKGDLKSSLNNSNRNDKMVVPVDFEIEEIKFDDETPSEQRVLKQMQNKKTEPLESHTPESENIGFEERSTLCKAEFSKTPSEQRVFTQMQNKKTEPLGSHTPESENISYEERSTLCKAEFSDNIDKKKKMKKDDKNEKSRGLETPLKETEGKIEITEKQGQTKPEKKKFKTSPKYKLKIESDGAWEIKKLSSRSSSATNSSKGFTTSKKIASNDSKSNKCSNYKTNKKRERYDRYLKRILEKQFLLKENKSEEEQCTEITKEIPDQDKNNEGITRLKLIAENEDDIFSLSSDSDSESGKEKNTGSGLLCDLFDE